jgi:hypothetical protein
VISLFEFVVIAEAVEPGGSEVRWLMVVMFEDELYSCCPVVL